MESPALSTTIENSLGSFSGNVTSQSWKDMCQRLPCSASMAWPGYETAVIDIVLDNQPAVIQLWKGWCQQLIPTINSYQFPGGVGAEVGVYKRTKPVDASNPVPASDALYSWFQNRIAQATGPLWWPAPELVSRIDYTLIEPNENIQFFTSTTDSYWNCKWMNYVPGWPKWKLSYYKHYWKSPSNYDDFILDFSITDKSGHQGKYRWAAHDTAVQPL